MAAIMSGGRGRCTGRGAHDRAGDLVELPLVGRDLVRQQLIDDRHVLLEPGDPLLVAPVGQPHHLVGGVAGQADAQPQIQAPMGDVIHGQRLKREHRRLPQRELADAGRDPDARGRLRDRRRQRPGLEPGRRRMAPVNEVIRDPGNIEPECLEALVAGEQLVPRHVGQGDRVELQIMRHGHAIHLRRF